jgi:hypothetical protein
MRRLASLEKWRGAQQSETALLLSELRSLAAPVALIESGGSSASDALLRADHETE